MTPTRSTITLTFGDQAENHVGMEKLGKLVEKGQGFTPDELRKMKKDCEEFGITCVLHHLGEEAYLLILQQAVDKILKELGDHTKEEMFEEQAQLDVDKHAFMYGEVRAKHARWNLCFDDEGHDPKYEEGKGRVVELSQIPITQQLFSSFVPIFGEKANNLKGEGNYYHDITKCGIGYHGDAERRKVIAVRLGASNPIHFQWYQNSLPIRDHMVFPLDGGDIYVMSEQTVGTDWKLRKIPTLRHAVGCNKYTKVE